MSKRPLIAEAETIQELIAAEKAAKWAMKQGEGEEGADCEDEDEDEDEDQDDDDEPSVPQEGDITTTDHSKFYQYWKLAFEVVSLENTTGGYRLIHKGKGWEQVNLEYPTLTACIQAFMEYSKFWPNVWFISDHGNPHRISLEDKSENG